MSIEAATYINQLDPTRPLAADIISEGDDHQRLMKSVTKASFPNIGGAVSASHTELSYVTGVTSAIQTQLNNLSSSSAALFTHAGSYAAGTVGAKLNRIIDVMDAPYNAVGDGVADDRGAFVLAMADLGTLGGAIRCTKKHLIDSSMTVPANVTILGPMQMVGSPGTNTSAPYGNMAALIVNSAATITLSGGAGVYGVLAYRKGVSFPIADALAFAGTCFTAAGDDCFLLNSMVFGFNKAYTSSSYQRPRIQNCNFDNINCIEVINCADISHIRNNHCWPFSTIQSYATTPTVSKLQRSGTAYAFSVVGDWNKVSDCFSYGYFKGFYGSSVNSMTFLNCSADGNAGAYTGAIGFLVDGTSWDTRFIACQAAAQDTGFQINTSAGKHHRLIGCDSWANITAGVVVSGGDVSITGGTHRNTVDGVRVTNASSKVYVGGGVRFEGLTGLPVSVTIANPYVQVDVNDYGDLAVGTSVATVANKTIPSIASANPLPVPNNGEVFNVSGVTNFGSINGGYAGRKITLIFTGVLTITSSTVNNASVYLKGGVNLTTAAGTAIQLQHNGTQWYELR